VQTQARPAIPPKGHFLKRSNTMTHNTNPTNPTNSRLHWPECAVINRAFQSVAMLASAVQVERTKKGEIRKADLKKHEVKESVEVVLRRTVNWQNCLISVTRNEARLMVHRERAAIVRALVEAQQSIFALDKPKANAKGKAKVQ
jgi:hypothetical protein